MTKELEVKEIPMMFKTAMVRAILKDLKQETRRIIKYKKKIENPNIGWTMFTEKGEFSVRGKHESGEYGESFFKMPFQTGNVIWVKETYSLTTAGVIYKADMTDQAAKAVKWKSGMYMPKEYARIWLRIDGVKAERLCEITPESAVREGIIREWDGTAYWYENYAPGSVEMIKRDPVASYKSLWELINGIGSWDQNPWVWAITFRKLKVNNG